MKSIDVCFSPLLFPAYNTKNALVIVVDIFRASTTICMALENGAKSIIPVSNIDEAKRYKSQGMLAGAERDVKRCDFADFGNSPFEYETSKVKDKEIVFTTTNGTQAINAAKKDNSIVIGAFINLSAVVRYCENQDRDVIILCSGWNNKVCCEDMIYAGAIVELLMKNNNFHLSSDSALISEHLWQLAKNETEKFLYETDHAKRLLNHNLVKDLKFCLQIDLINSIPVLKQDKLVKIDYENLL